MSALAELRSAQLDTREADRIKAVVLLVGDWVLEDLAEALLVDVNTVRNYFGRVML